MKNWNAIAHPVTTVLGLIGSGVLVATNQPDWIHLIQAIAVAVFGAWVHDPKKTP